MFFGNSDNFNICPECHKGEEQIRRESRLQEEGRIQARQNARNIEYNRREREKDLKNLRKRLFG